MDIRSLGCPVHELLTSERTFSEASGNMTDDMTGLETSEVEKPHVNMGLLREYRVEFPTKVQWLEPRQGPSRTHRWQRWNIHNRLFTWRSDDIAIRSGEGAGRSRGSAMAIGGSEKN